MPLTVTVVIPTHNRAVLVQRALSSIRRQHQMPQRIIVVDDCSTDGTPEAAKACGHRLGLPLHVEVLGRNGGPAIARNRGIELADTDLVTFLDSDDEHLPTTLQRLCGALERHPGAVAAFGDATVVTADGDTPHGLLAPRLTLADDGEALGDGWFRMRDPTEKLLPASIIPTSAICFRRRAALAVGNMPGDFRSGEDWLFFLRLSGAGNFVFTPDDLALHHRHVDNLTSPSAGEFIAREKLLGLLALRNGSLGIQLTPAQRQRVESMLPGQRASWRYHLSTLGWRRYWRGLRGPVGRSAGGWLQHVLDSPRSVVRSAVASVQRARRRQ